MGQYSDNARLEDGFSRGQAAAQAGSARPTPGTRGFENSNLSNAWFAGFDSVQKTPEPSSGGGGGGESYSAPASLLPMPSTPAPEPINPPAPMNLPNLTLSDGASTVYQLNKLQSMDSLPMKQAEVNAFERGVASGAIHSSQQAGAAQRAVTDKLMPLAKTEADLVGNTEIANWSAEVKKEMQRYTSEYSGYLAKLGIQSSEKIAMATANTSLSNSLLSSMTSLMNNPEIEFGDEVKNKLTSIFNNAMINNNTILDMGFSY